MMKSEKYSGESGAKLAHIRRSGALLLLALPTLLLCSGCWSWKEMHYSSPPPFVTDVDSGEILSGVFWNFSTDSAGCCLECAGYLTRGKPHDSLLIKVQFTPADTSFHLDQFPVRYGIDNVGIEIDGKVFHPRLCDDTTLAWHYHDYVTGGERRSTMWVLYYGPVPSPWPAPDSAIISLDFVTFGDSTGAEIKREHVVNVEYKKSKSYLRAFLEGR